MHTHARSLATHNAITHNFFYFIGDQSLVELDRVALAMESISASDLIGRAIMAEQHFELMPLHAIMSTVRPAALVRGNLGEMVSFPQLLGTCSDLLSVCMCISMRACM